MGRSALAPRRGRMSRSWSRGRPMLPPDLLAPLIGLVVLGALAAYAVLAGPDFGGGVLDLLASGRRQAEQRAAIAAAMGPGWEANQVWLIFLLIILFTAYPAAFAALSI